ncbi:MAG: TonB C-terminal domain-containing protein [Halioglobus sp.]|nr:TonB C-terminal domain-containing protein [Halioglobus sp.]
MIYLLTVNWSSSDYETVKVKPAPKAIKARLVDVSELRPKPAATKPKPKPKPAAPKPKPKPAAPKPKPVEPKVEAKPEPKPEPRLSPEELAAMARAELADTIAREDALEATATAGEMAASFAALIQGTVVNYWSRPPSARNGMEALLSIQLIPTGEVVSVQILKSSGNTAFDNSAVNAVRKAGSFPELQQLPSREFERSFRRFRLLFRPEDLRY